MTEIDKIRCKFYFDDEGNPEINHYGKYMRGLTGEEIKDYIRVRAGKIRVEGLVKKFYEIAGVNTCAIHICPHCKERDILMYRHDVLRFADVLFLNKPTYWD